jgi:hypothetical protein
MRTTLISTALAGLIALGALPAAAAEGPGRDIDRLQAVIAVDYDNGWRIPSQPGYYGPGGYPNWNRDWHNPDSYDRPSWGWGSNGWWNGGYHQYRQPLPEWVIRHRIQRQNYHDIGRLKLRDGSYRVNAENWRGQDVRLVVDAYTGRVLDVDRR